MLLTPVQTAKPESFFVFRCVLGHYVAFTNINTQLNLSEGADSVGRQLRRGDKECPFRSVTSLVWQSLEEGAGKRGLERGKLDVSEK